MSDVDVSSWLSECRTKSTRSTYIWRISFFFKWLGKEKNLSLEQWKALGTKEMKTLLLQFQNSEPVGEGHVYTRKHRHGHMKDASNLTVVPGKSLSANGISGVMTAVQSFGMYLEKPLLLKGKRINGEDDTHSHYFANGDLGKMYDVADVRGKALISSACSLGWEEHDFIQLDKDLIQAHIKKADAEGKEYVYFETIRTKTHVPRLAVLNPLAIYALKEYWKLYPDQSPFSISKSGLNTFIKRVAHQANLNTTGLVRFHRIRAWTFNSLLKGGFSDSEAKYIVGKAIPHGDATYLRLKEGIEQKYPKLYNHYLNIKPQRMIIQEDIKRENEDLKKRLERTEEMLVNLEKAVRELRQQT